MGVDAITVGSQIAVALQTIVSRKLNPADNGIVSITEFITSISFNFPDPWFKKKHHKRRVIQPDLINLLSNSMKKGSLIFIKTDVRELFDHIELTISENIKFKKLAIKDVQFNESFNPNRIQTNREKYVILNQLEIHESIYKKI